LSETPRHSLVELVEALGVRNDPSCRMPASRTLHVVTVRHVGVWTQMAARVDRLRGVGNGVVPLVAAYAFCTLAAQAGLDIDRLGR
jgi:hypothetical protein